MYCQMFSIIKQKKLDFELVFILHLRVWTFAEMVSTAFITRNKNRNITLLVASSVDGGTLRRYVVSTHCEARKQVKSTFKKHKI